MLDMKEIEWAIGQLERQESSFAAYSKLADLYVIRDQNSGEKGRGEPAPAQPAAPLGRYGGSEFLQAAAGKNPEALWPILDELMDTVQTLHPRIYQSVMRKILEE